MPTTRHRTSRGRTVLTLDSLPFHDVLSLVSGWQPPRNDFEHWRARWFTWEEFVRDYALVRDEFLREELGRRDGVLPFAEWLYQTYDGQAPPPEDQLLVQVSPYPAVMPTVKVIARYREECQPERPWYAPDDPAKAAILGAIHQRLTALHPHIGDDPRGMLLAETSDDPEIVGLWGDYLTLQLAR